jgi:hypothetical protein
MDRKASQEKVLIAYREKQRRIADLLSRIKDKLARHAGPVVCWGHVGDLGHVENLLNQIDTFLN